MKIAPFFLSMYMGYLMSLVLCSASTEGDTLLRIMRTWNQEFPTWTGADPCQDWEGVNCSSQGHVVYLNLTNMNIQGSIPAEIGQLTFLTTLDLSNSDDTSSPYNQITGPLPPELVNLIHLQTLYLSKNPLNIPFPSILSQIPSLQDLRMDFGNISGPIPDSISQLMNLKILYLGNNSLIGPLPSTLGQMTSLEQLTLWGNQFNQKIPVELGNLIHLQYLNLHDCLLWGALPSEFGNLKSLTRLLLYSNDLTGYFPSSWHGLTSVLELDLSQNSISGPFPDWLPNMPNLMDLDLHNNELEGPFPAFNGSENLFSSSKNLLNLNCNFFNGSYPAYVPSNVNYSGNCFDNQTSTDIDISQQYCKRNFYCRDFFPRILDGCAPCPSGNFILDNATICTCKLAQGPGGGSSPVRGSTPSSRGKSLSAAVGGVVGALAIIVALLALYKWKPLKDHPFDPFNLFTRETGGDWEIPAGVHRYSLEQLIKATRNFDEAHEIGVGGFGKVFCGTLEDGKMVAIKRASETSFQGEVEFRNEVLLLSRLHHRHLVRLEGFCDDQDLQILVYEFMKNGNLHDWLINSKRGKHLDWLKRLEITVGIAQVLDYLHSFADPPVIHRDIKPSNILLDEFLVAKLSDFGISRESQQLGTHISTRPAGTAGYLDPEYYMRRQLTTASDVYGFGVVLMEIITGQEAIDHDRKEEFNLVEWVKPRFRQAGVRSIVDPVLQDNYNEEVFRDMTKVALMCSAMAKNDRPNMKEVLNYLEPYLRAFQPSALSERSSLFARSASSSYSMQLGPEATNRSALELKSQQNSVTMSSTGATVQFNLGANVLPR